MINFFVALYVSLNKWLYFKRFITMPLQQFAKVATFLSFFSAVADRIKVIIESDDDKLH